MTLKGQNAYAIIGNQWLAKAQRSASASYADLRLSVFRQSAIIRMSKNSNHSLVFLLLSMSTTVKNRLLLSDRRTFVRRRLNCNVVSIIRCSVKCLIVVIRTPRFFGGWGWTGEWHNYVGATWCDTLWQGKREGVKSAGKCDIINQWPLQLNIIQHFWPSRFLVKLIAVSRLFHAAVSWYGCVTQRLGD